MTNNYEEKIADLDKKIEMIGDFVNHHINGHEQRFSEHNEHLKKLLKMVTDAHKRCDGLEGAIRILKRMVETLGDEQARMRRVHMKYDDAYYHIFPDRLVGDVKLSDQLDALTSQDRKFRDQLDALTPKTRPDGEGKGS